MKAIRVNEPGGPEVMSYEDVPMPEPGAGEARVRLAAAGVNFIDVYQRTGLYPKDPPFTLGQEGAGEVDAVGEGVEDLSVGDYVAFANVLGAYAEYVVAPAEKLVPFNVTLVEARVAAAAMLQGMTAHYLTHSTFPLQEGHTALVHAAAGGVGLLLVQMAKMRGATVIGTVGSEEKAKLAKGAGADEVILYKEQDFVAETSRITGDEGVDVVYDSVGKDTFDGGLGTEGGCLQNVGDTSRAAEALGFVSLWTSETKHDASLPLAIAASETERIGLGTSVAIAFSRSPMEVAQTAWDLQDFSGGRFILGLGTQVRAHIRRRFSMPWDRPVGRLREYVGALRAIWTTFQSEGPLNFEGEFYRHTLMTPFFNPGPIERPEIPIYVAGVNTSLAL